MKLALSDFVRAGLFSFYVIAPACFAFMYYGARAIVWCKGRGSALLNKERENEMNTFFAYQSRSQMQSPVNVSRVNYDGFVALRGPGGSVLFAGRFVALKFCAAEPRHWWRVEAWHMLRDVADSQGGCLYDQNGTFTLVLPADQRALDGLRLAGLAELTCRPAGRDEFAHERRLAALWAAGLAGPLGDRLVENGYCGPTLTEWGVLAIEFDEPAVDANGEPVRQRCTVTCGCDGETYNLRIPADWPEAMIWQADAAHVA